MGVFSLPQQPCDICGLPTRSSFRICQRSSSCKQEYHRRAGHKPLRQPAPCELCQRPTRSIYGVCYSTAECKSLFQKRVWEANPEKRAYGQQYYQDHRADWKKRPSYCDARKRHGDWQPWWDIQHGLCYLCEKPLPTGRSQMTMDHDHNHCLGVNSCERCRRGLTHSICNSLVGRADDDPGKLMVIAINFEKAHAASKVRIESGLSPKQRKFQWQSFCEAQHGMCYLCEEPLPTNRSKMHMDHDHECCPNAKSCEKCRRGLTHINCNTLLGMAGDDPEKLMRIALRFAKVHEQTRQRIEAASS